HNNYPIIGMDGLCKGLIRITEITEKRRKKVILVDHNEFEQSAEGLDEAEIIEVIDHHKVGNISTTNPINFRIMTVGCTNTIIYTLYQENNIKIPREMAGLMLSGILSDTLSLTSPTTTQMDRFVVEELATMLNMDYQAYALEMFKSGTSLEGKSIEQIVCSDLKSFQIDDEKFAVSQVFTLNYEEILKNKDDYIQFIEQQALDKDYQLIVVLVTDIIKNGSYIFYTRKDQELLEIAFNNEKLRQGSYLDGCVSRKKQAVPAILEVLKK
ncbi:MAG: DHH family phosphoesterase, partial [bacterium]|nr:DHH family phosphoesterase [bacterium]